MKELNQEQLLKWTKLITEKPETIISIGDVAPYSLVRLAVEHKAPAYALSAVNKETLDKVCHDINLDQANRILRETSNHPTFSHGLVSIDTEYGDRVIFGSNEIPTKTMSFILSENDELSDKYDVTLADLPRSYSAKYNRFSSYEPIHLGTILLQERITLSELALDEDKVYYIAEMLNLLADKGKKALAIDLLQDLYDNNNEFYVRLMLAFEGWAATHVAIQSFLKEHTPEVSQTVWQRGYDVYLNREDLLSVKSAKKHRKEAKEDEEREKKRLQMSKDDNDESFKMVAIAFIIAIIASMIAYFIVY